MFRNIKIFLPILALFFCFTVYADSNWQTLKRITYPEILFYKISERDAFDIFELSLSSEARVVKQSQSSHYVVFHIVPMLKPVNFSIWKAFKENFKRFNIEQRAGYTEIFLSSDKRLGSPYIEKTSSGEIKLCIPKLVRQTKHELPNGKIISDGIRYYHDITTVASVKQTHIYVIKISPTKFADIVWPSLAHEGIARKERLSSMAKRYNAICGINAGFFAAQGNPLGILIINRKLLSSPIYGRSVCGITDDNNIVFGNPDFSGNFKTGNINISIDGVNQTRRINSLVVYTSEYAPTTMTEDDGVELILVKGKIVAIQNKNSSIPPDGVVISASGSKAQMLKEVKLGAATYLNYSVDEPWSSIKHAVGGGPRLLKDGKIFINGEEEHFSSSITTGRHPRTAIGVTFDGALVLLAADGRTKESAGMTLHELASYMKSIGVENAINLDGGGSTTMWVKGKIVNVPSDGAERAISNGIVIINE